MMSLIFFVIRVDIRYSLLVDIHSTLMILQWNTPDNFNTHKEEFQFYNFSIVASADEVMSEDL